MPLCVVVMGDKGEPGAQAEVKESGQTGTGGGVKRPGQFGGDRFPDAKRKRTT